MNGAGALFQAVDSDDPEKDISPLTSDWAHSSPDVALTREETGQESFADVEDEQNEQDPEGYGFGV